MTTNDSETKARQSLRQRAEEKLKTITDTTQIALSSDETNRLVHDLQVHQIELEMQNEELQRAQLELAAAKECYLDLYDLAPVGYLSLSDKGLIITANLTAATLLAVPRGSLLIQPLSRYILKEDQDIYYQLHKNLFKTSEPQECEIRLLKNDGTTFWAQLKANLAANNDDGSAGVCRIMLHDISDRKQAEDENDKLHTQLNQAQKMEAIGILAGGIAHDFNNILSVILGYTELTLDDTAPDSKSAQFLVKVLEATYRARDLVKQILTFSRQSSVDLIPVKIQPMVKGVLKTMRSIIPSTISIVQEIQSDCGAVLADLTQVHQIVMNLCTNAFQSMESTGGELSITVQTTWIDAHPPFTGLNIPPGEYVELRVSDTGSGIGPDIIDRIFDPFFTTKEVGKGTGMGLSIVHGIITAYSGAITVESTMGKGTTFHVYFPVTQELPQEITQSQETPRGKGRILFVDDEEMLAEMGKTILERLGYSVTVRCNSIEALETFRSEPEQFDLMITDQTMPGMTGVDLARGILQLRPEFPIILCTGYSSLINEESAKVVGIREFALKPLTRSSLSQLVNKILGGGN